MRERGARVGDFRLTSQPGQGTTIQVTVPLETPAGAPMTETPKIRVLVADDHQVVRVGLRSIIDAEPDMEVVAEAADGRSAIAAFAAHRPDITLLDLRMPGLSGAHVITEIRKLSPRPTSSW